MRIEDMLMQLKELEHLYGNMFVTTKQPCAHEYGEAHNVECYDQASIKVRELPGGNRVVVIE
jgi:hypothetical protein